jgi:hypothetical protein
MAQKPGYRTLLLAGSLIGAMQPVYARADDARELLKSMSDFMAKQETLSFDYNSSVEVVSPEFQKLQFASSGSVSLERPERINVTRIGGFADLQTVYDGNTLTVYAKNANQYAQLPAKGTLDDLGALLESAGAEPPGADILGSDVFGTLMEDVTDAKHISSAYVDGVECEYLAFRNRDVDWQIWIQSGDEPLPLRYVVTSKHEPQAPQYTLETRNWKRGSTAASTDFAFVPPAGAKAVDLSEIVDVHEIPSADAGELQ